MEEFTETLSASQIYADYSGHWWSRKRPIANDDHAKTDEDSPVTFNILDNDKRVDGFFIFDGKTYSSAHSGEATTAKGAIITWDEDGNVTYDPNGRFESLDDGETATDGFHYVALNRKGFDFADVKITIHGVDDEPDGNTPPVAINDFASVPTAYPYPFPYPHPYPLPLADAQTNDLLTKPTEIDPDIPIVTTLAIGEEGPPPFPKPSEVDIDVLKNDFDADGDALSVGTINGKQVGIGDTVKLPSGATVTVDDDGSLVYKGGIIGYGGPLPYASQSYSLVEEANGATSIESLTLPVPLPKPIPFPYLADIFTYQAFDGEDLSDPAKVIVTRTFPPIYIDAEPVTGMTPTPDLGAEPPLIG